MRSGHAVAPARGAALPPGAEAASHCLAKARTRAAASCRRRLASNAACSRRPWAAGATRLAGGRASFQSASAACIRQRARAGAVKDVSRPSACAPTCSDVRAQQGTRWRLSRPQARMHGPGGSRRKGWVKGCFLGLWLKLASALPAPQGLAARGRWEHVCPVNKSPLRLFLYNRVCLRRLQRRRGVASSCPLAARGCQAAGAGARLRVCVTEKTSRSRCVRLWRISLQCACAVRPTGPHRVRLQKGKHVSAVR